MSIRIRNIDGRLVALCAARSMPMEGDIYLDDAVHHALASKFTEDFESEGLIERRALPHPVRDIEAELRAREESNNPNRTWWDSVYG